MSVIPSVVPGPTETPQHSHYSPFRFMTPTQLAEPNKKVRADRKEMMALAHKQKQKTRNMSCTIPLTVAHSVSSRPQAFISPNPTDVMRMTNSVFGF